MTVPTLDKTVFTPGAPRDYVGHAIEIAKMYPDYGKMMQDARKAEQERQAMQLKYETDKQKAQQFLDLYPHYRDAQIAQLDARTALANAQAATTPGLRDAQIARLNAQAADIAGRNSPKGDPRILGLLDSPLEGPPGSQSPAAAAGAAAAPVAEQAPPPVVAPEPNSWDQTL